MRLAGNRFESARARSVAIALLAALLALTAGCDAFRSKEARIEEAREALAAGDFRAASIELKSVLDSDPDNADARLALAETSLAVGDAESAEKELRRALAAGLPAERAAALQGRVMLALGQSAELLQKLNDRSLPVQEPDWSLLKGDALVTVGDTAAAEALYRSVLDAHPEHVRASRRPGAHDGVARPGAAGLGLPDQLPEGATRRGRGLAVARRNSRARVAVLGG